MRISDLFRGTPRASSRDASDDYWYRPLSRPVAAGVSVTVESALTLPVVYGCHQVLSQSIAALPYAVFERIGNEGERTRRDEHPAARLLVDPNPETTSFEFFGQLVWDIASYNEAMFEMVAGPGAVPSELWRIDPATVTVERLDDRGGRRYRIQEQGRPERILLDDDVWHLRALPLTSDGLRSVSPIHLGREAIGAALALQDYAARFFNNDATPPFVIKHPGNFKDDASRDNFLGAVRRWWGGTRRHSPGVLEHGMDIAKVGTSNEEAQFLETRNAHDVALTRLWRMPPHKVGIMDRATFTNIEHQGLEFVTDTLLPILRLIERSVAKSLLLDPRRFLFEFNVAGLLRGDVRARYMAYAAGRQWGWLSVNEIRRLENMNPIDEGNVYLQPSNMQPADSSNMFTDGEDNTPPPARRDGNALFSLQ